MNTETWKVIWEWVFIFANVSFYLVVANVAVRGFGDVIDILRKSPTAPNNKD